MRRAPLQEAIAPFSNVKLILDEREKIKAWS